MTPDGTDDAVHFRGKTLTPESPRPLHFSEPHSIPVLENQIDPALNVTSYFEGPLNARGDDFPNIAEEVEDPAHLTKQLFSRTVELFRNGTNTLGQGQYAGLLDTGYRMSTPLGPTAPDNVNGYGNGNATDQPDLVSDSDDASPSDTTPSHAPTGHASISASTRSDPTANDQAADEMIDGVCDGEVNFQNLLDNLSQPATATPHAPRSSSSTLSPLNDASSPLTDPFLPSGLPPRPPPQDKPSIHPNYLPTDDIRSFHPASTQNPDGPSHYPASSLHQPESSPIESNAAPGTTSVLSELPPPPVAAFQQSHPTALPKLPHGEKQGKAKVLAQDRADEAPWSTEVQKKYDDFLQQERVYVTEGLWDRFPMGSRLFVGMYLI